MYYNLTNLRLLAEGALTESQYKDAELNEVTKFDKYRLYNSNKAKELSSTLREAKSESDDKKAIALYKKALELVKELKKEANKIDNDDFGTWAINLLIKPWWWFIIDVAQAVTHGDSITEMTRSQAIQHFEQIEKVINRQINVRK